MGKPMKDENRTKSDLIRELKTLRKRVTKLEVVESKRKRLEEELRENEERFRAIANYTYDWVNWISPDGKLLWTNPVVETITGYSIEEYLNLSDRLRQVVVEDDYEMILSHFKRGLEQKSSGNEISFRIRHKCGSISWAAVSYQPIYAVNGDYLGLRSSIRDIKERKCTEDALRESEAKYRSLFENSLDAILLTAPDGKIFSANPAACQMYGRTEQEICKAGREGLVDIQDPGLAELLQRRARTGKAIGEFYQYRKDGTRFLTEVSSTIFETTEGQRTSMIIRDISERKRIKQDLRIGSTIIANMSEGVNLVRVSDGIIVFTNPRFDHMFGYDPGELIGKSIAIVNAPAQKTPKDIAKEIMAELSKTGEWKGEIYNIKKDGTPFWCYVGISTFEHLGHDTVWVSIHTDITERKKAEEALRKSAMNLAESQRIGKLGCWDWDIAGNSLSWSDENYRIWGIGKDFLLTFDNIAGMIHPDDRESNSKKVQEFLAVLDKGEFEFRIICPDGTVKYIYQSIEVTRAPSGQPIRIFGIMQNITERKRTEEELRKYQELLRSFLLSQQARIEEERTRIAREIHDDLGQLLTAIKMDISMVGKQLSAVSDHETRALWDLEVDGIIRLIDRGIGSVRKIVRDLRPEVLDTLGIIDSIKWQAEEFTRRTTTPCAFQSSVEHLELDTYRSTALFRIVQESLLNVTKHTNATHVEIVFSRSEKNIILEIRDNGCGFVPEEVNTSLSFGLLGIRERVQPFGGKVEILSAPMKGTTITITLPL
jgi:PAS domain S-box-containing protein